ncbi:MAG: YfhO family protein, partial [Gemmatimonadales bacterium]
GLVVACQIFTPHVQLMYYSSLSLSLYALVRLFWLARAEGDWRPAGRLFGYFALGFVAAALVGMAQLLPTLDLTRIAVRGGGETGYAFAASWAMPPQELTGFVLPDLIGSLGTYWGANPFKQHTEYLGIVTAALAVIGITGVRRDRRIGLVGAIALLCVLFALGAATPVHRIAYYLIPMVKKFRAASMMLGPAALFIALLAGFGWQRVLEARRAGDDGLPWTWIVGLSAPVLLLGLGAALNPGGLVRWVHTSWFPAGWAPRPGPEGIALLRAGGWWLLALWSAVWGVAWAVERRRLPHAAVVVLLALLVADQARIDSRYISVVTPAEAFPDDTLADQLYEELSPAARVFPLPERGGYGPNALMLHDIRSVTGMQNFRLRWTDQLIGGLSYENLLSPGLWPLFDLEYVITQQQVQTPLLEPGPSGSRGTAWRVTAATPHAWFPQRVVPEPDARRAVTLLRQRADPAAFGFVAPAGTPGGVPTVGPDSVDIPAGQGTAVVTRFAPNEMVLDVEADRGGLLVVSEIYHPNWHATVDGADAPVVRADVAMRGVEVPEGRHEVRFTYAAGTVRSGLIVGFLALIVTFVGILVDVRLSRNGDGESVQAEGLPR